MQGLPVDVQARFGAVDWAIVAVYIVVTTYIGLRARRYVHDMDDYVVAGRSLRSWAAIATMIGSELGLVTVMYSAQKGFTGGLAAFHIPLVAGLVTLLVGLTGFIVVPLRRAGVMTIPEFYEQRFGRGVRVLGGVVLAFSGILNMGLYLKVGSLFVTGLTGMTSELELKLVMTGLLLLVLFYTTLGGMLSVVVTDYFQFVLLSVTLIVTCALAFSDLGWERIVDGVTELRGVAGVDPLHAEGFGPLYIVWQIFVAGLVSCAIWQTAVMRALAVESVSLVRRLYTWSSIGFTIRFLLPQFLGVCALVTFAADPEMSSVFLAPGAEDAERSLLAMPVYLGRMLPAGLLGLTAAGMLAAFMSTHDSYLLSWSSVLTQDVVAPLFGELSTRARLLLTRVLVFVIGGFLLVWGLWYPLGQDLWDYMAVTGAVYFTGAFTVLVPGLYWRRASRTGAFLALLAGLFALTGLAPVQAALGVAWPSEAVGLGTTALALVGMVGGSLAFPDAAPDVPNEAA